ncbi:MULTISPECIES: hypothetical protein [unclassified Streptomyces]|uniref:hypothetical protein n=1 Tax=unclassified Streptomyces TaxID=2593676 RepID=UPI002254F2B5|nr:MULTISPECIES: hypothetical protein [unclassified Streptomyces]MCX4403668.1 hypothetical protein [Streptomyces sp. NBC_01764]MCX5181379.1 hypothetical protein [Streptomyces sp. NBC_00268]
MIKIEYHQTGPYVDQGQENREGVDLASVSRADLRWYYFLSDLTFTIGEADLTPPWSWTPVFDFLWSMKGALEHLERGEPTTIGFTENAELINFVQEGEKVRVSCTYATAEAVCERVDLKNAWLILREAVLAQLSGEYPKLAANPVLAELRL